MFSLLIDRSEGLSNGQLTIGEMKPFSDPESLTAFRDRDYPWQLGINSWVF
ncbi:MAG: hypothetical protein V2B13_11465 [Pseudomonadota bacterium]